MTQPPVPPVSFDISGEVCVVTGGSGTLGGAMARGLSRSGAKVAVLGRNAEAVETATARLRAGGGEALGLVADVLEMSQLEAASAQVVERWGRVDVLVNAAGGNLPAAIVPATGTLFDLAPEAFRSVVDLNLTGTLLPTLVFAKAMVAVGKGSIINISSMNASRPLSRTAGYGAAKAAVDNLTRWLADDVARHFSPRIPRERHRPGVPPRRAEQGAAHQHRRLAHRAGPGHGGANPDGALRGPGGPGRAGRVAGLRGELVRDRGGRAGRRRLLGGGRHLAHLRAGTGRRELLGNWLLGRACQGGCRRAGAGRSEQRAQQDQPVARPQQLAGRPFGVRHQPDHVPLLVAHPRHVAS